MKCRRREVEEGDSKLNKTLSIAVVRESISFVVPSLEDL